jgi:hypothetical protein
LSAIAPTTTPPSGIHLIAIPAPTLSIVLTGQIRSSNPSL